MTAPVTNANGCTTVGTPGNDTLTDFGRSSAVLCGLGGNDVYREGGASNVKTYLGSGHNQVALFAISSGVVFGGFGPDTITAMGSRNNAFYAGDVLYPGAAPTRSTQATPPMATPASSPSMTPSAAAPA